MKTLTTKQIKTQITSLTNASSEDNLQTLFVNIVMNGLIHSNVMPETLIKIRESKLNSKFKAAINKFVPAKFDKKLNTYVFDKVKAEKLQAELGVTYMLTTLDELSNALPNIFEKKEKETKEFNVDDYMTKVAATLAKNGVENADTIIALAQACMSSDEVLRNCITQLVSEEKESNVA